MSRPLGFDENVRPGDVMTIDPSSKTLSTAPGQPAEPPRESPPGKPNPDIPPPVREPGEPSRPDELPGHVPDELPLPGPHNPPPPPAPTSV